MKFLIYLIKNVKVDKSGAHNFNKIKKRTTIFSNDEVSIFHYNQLNNEIVHTVFNIKDEYQVGTKLSGNQLNFPVTHYINTFFHVNSQRLFIENVNEKYCEEITKYLTTNMDFIIEAVMFDSDYILSVVKQFDAKIKKVELKDKLGEEDYFFEENLSYSFLKEKIMQNYSIDYISMLIENNFVSIKQSGAISVNCSELEYITKFIEELFQ
jgi:hypothetical protein